MKRIILTIFIAALSPSLYGDTQDLIINIAQLVKGIPASKDNKAKKEKVVNLLMAAAGASTSIEAFVNQLPVTQAKANLVYKRAVCLGKSSAACSAVGCTNEAACIQKLLVVINELLKPLINTLIGEKTGTDKDVSVKKGALMSLLTILPENSPRRTAYNEKLVSYVMNLNDIFDFLNSLGFIINPAALKETSEETAKMKEGLKKALAEETVQVKQPEQQLVTEEGVDVSDFLS